MEKNDDGFDCDILVSEENLEEALSFLEGKID